MTFNSYGFILCFLPIALIGYYFFNGREQYKCASIWMIVISCFFYGYSQQKGLVVLLLNVVINYWLANNIQKEMRNSKRKWLLITALSLNVALLAFFRYYASWTPLGISFITFGQLAYLIDSYNKKDSGYTLLHYTEHVTFFPKIISGPIALHDELIPQFEEQMQREIDYASVARGIYLFTLGLCKKVLMANNLAQMADWGYSNLSSLNRVTACVTTICYSLQIYFDFSGYCDMAKGIAHMFQINLPWNFRSPYKATSISDFWNRWHITLTRFFTRYLYIPLGGNRKGLIRTYVNVLIVFLISGVWHGSSLNFIVWGLLHGLAMVLYRLFQNIWEKIPKIVKIFCTLLYVNFAWIFFRADTMTDAFEMIRKIFSGAEGSLLSGLCAITGEIPEITILTRLMGMGDSNLLFAIWTWIVVAALLGVVLFTKNTEEKMEEFVPSIKSIIITIGLLFWCIISISGVSQFVYANF